MSDDAGLATKPVRSEDHQVFQVVGEIAADAFAAEAIVLAAADKIQAASDSVTDGLPDAQLARDAQVAAAQAKVAVDRFSYQTASRLFDAGGASSDGGDLQLGSALAQRSVRVNTQPNVFEGLRSW
jgi:alkylation response protein AidB-like acyl-CoA dehydrogenase